MTPAAALVMSDGQREALQGLSRSQTAPHRQVQRAKALLLAADGVANIRIAAQVGVKPATVRAWRARFAEEGLAKLGKVRAGRGRKSTIPQEKIDEIVHLTRHSTPDGQTHWSCRTMAAKAGVSPATVQRVWAARGPGFPRSPAADRYRAGRFGQRPPRQRCGGRQPASRPPACAHNPALVHIRGRSRPRRPNR
jgi:transposase